VHRAPQWCMRWWTLHQCASSFTAKRHVAGVHAVAVAICRGGMMMNNKSFLYIK